MPNVHRDDERGAIHHVMNRGMARRTVFESRADMRLFLSLWARCVRRRKIELLDFTLLTTHFHALVRSVTGELSATLGWIENQYVRAFNRTRRRDGSLFRGRFRSKRVAHADYEAAVRGYIAANAVAAGLVSDPRLYPWCSASWRARERAPRWLAAEPAAGNLNAPPPEALWVVERRIERAARDEAERRLDEGLLGAAAPRVLEWMRRKAFLADGTDPGQPLAAPQAVATVLASSELPVLDLEPHHRRASPATTAAVGLYRLLCGLDWEEIATRTGLARTTARSMAILHATRLRERSEYELAVAAIAAKAMRVTYRGNSGPEGTGGIAAGR